MKGHRIISVNGICGDASKLRKEIINACRLKIQFEQSSTLTHGAVSPESVMLNSHGDLQLASPVIVNAPNFCSVSALKVESPYHSPERSCKGAFDNRDDVWAVGCIVTELLTGMM